MGDLDETLGCGLWYGPALTAVGIWGENQEMENLYYSASQVAKVHSSLEGIVFKVTTLVCA